MPITEEELRQLLEERTGEPVTAQDVQIFLHEQFTYEQRMAEGNHDVLNCEYCQDEVAGQR